LTAFALAAEELGVVLYTLERVYGRKKILGLLKNIDDNMMKKARGRVMTSSRLT